jgi:hypothetical protein
MEVTVGFPVEPPDGACYRVEAGDGLLVGTQACRGLEPFRMRLPHGSYNVRLMQGTSTLSARAVMLSSDQAMSVAVPRKSR